MKNKRSDERSTILIGILVWVLFIVFMVTGYMLVGEDKDMLLFIGGTILGSSVVVSLVALLNITLVRYFRIRRAALKAMGKGAYSAVMRDRVAKIAYKGIFAFVSGDTASAEEHLIKALNLSDVRQNQLFCIEWLSRVYEMTDDSAKIMWAYRKAADYAPDNPEIQSRLGHAYYVEGKLDQAVYCFEQALHYDPNHGYSRYSIAKVHAVRGEDDIAVAQLEELAAIQENHPLVYSELAVLYAMNRNKEKCRENYEKAILCGYDQAQVLSGRITAIFRFNESGDADGSNLPSEYYRHIQTEEEKKPQCSGKCEHCDLNKKCEKGEDDAGNE